MKKLTITLIALAVITVLAAIAIIAVFADAAGQPMRVHPSVSGFEEIDIYNRCYRLYDSEDAYVIDSAGNVTIGVWERRDHSSHTLETDDGVFIGVNRGEWGGGLSFSGNDGGEDYGIRYVRNVRALLKYKDGIYALSGLAHLTSDGGGLHRLGVVDGKWEVTFSADLGSCPDYYQIIGDKLYISTGIGLAEFDGDTLRQLIGKPLRWYGASSIFINEKIIAAGGRGFLTVYDRKANTAKSYRQAIDPADAAAHRARAAEHLCKGDLKPALADYGKAIKIEPDSANTYILRGDVYYNADKYARAISNYSKAIKLQPNAAETYLKRGNSRMFHGRYDSAIEDFNQVIRMEPSSSLAYYYRGATFSKKRIYDAAIVDFDRAISMDRLDDDALYGRALAYLDNGDTALAVADLEAMLRINSQHTASDQAWQIIDNARKNKTGGEPCPPAAADAFVDPRDCKKYRTVKISGTTWMAENLNHKIGGSMCYNDDDGYCQIYGQLYDWNTAMRACPAGWKLPDTADWNNLMRAAGGMYIKNTSVHGGPNYWPGAGKILKSKEGWSTYVRYPLTHSDMFGRFDIDRDGTDLFGFSALPGGMRDWVSSAAFDGTGNSGNWWSATESESYSRDAYYREIYYMRSRVNDSWSDKRCRFSVRCVLAEENPNIPSTPPSGPIPKGIMWRCNDDASGPAAGVIATLTKEGTLIVGGKGTVDSCGGRRHYGFGIKTFALVIEDGITAIGKTAFGGYEYAFLATVTVLNPVPPKMGAGAFGTLPPDTLYVPKSSVGAYRAAAGWKEFKYVEAIESAN